MGGNPEKTQTRDQTSLLWGDVSALSILCICKLKAAAPQITAEKTAKKGSISQHLGLKGNVNSLSFSDDTYRILVKASSRWTVWTGWGVNKRHSWGQCERFHVKPFTKAPDPFWRAAVPLSQRRVGVDSYIFNAPLPTPHPLPVCYVSSHCDKPVWILCSCFASSLKLIWSNTPHSNLLRRWCRGMGEEEEEAVNGMSQWGGSCV